jgi:hypothetical protein
VLINLVVTIVIFITQSSICSIVMQTTNHTPHLKLLLIDLLVLSLKIAPKRGRLEINFGQDAVLMLSSMNLPDGIQVCLSIFAL